MQHHYHYKMHNDKNNSSSSKKYFCCCSCNMPQAWKNSTMLVSADEALSSSSLLPARNTDLQEDPVEHRLHCQISDCVLCRCDSGCNMAFKCSPSHSSHSSSLPSTTTLSSPLDRTTLRSCCSKKDDNDDCITTSIVASSRQQHYQQRQRSSSSSFNHLHHHHRHNLLLSSTTLSPPCSSTQSSSVVEESCHHRHQCCCCEQCQYCCVCTVNTSSICSDHVVTTSSSTSVSSSHVCSCICKTLNLQPETKSNSNNSSSSSNTTVSVNNPNPTHLHRTRCSCSSSWTFTTLANIFQSFMSRLSGRLRRPQRRRLLTSSSLYGWEKMTSFLYTFVTVATFCLSFLPLSDACSSRSTPKPRPPSPTLRPNITIQTYTCPPEYDAHYCLNGATCFTVKIGESILYNCECAEGYMGQRCEFKDLDGSYLPSKQRAMLEQAGLTSGAAIIVVIVVIVCFYLYVRSRRKFEISQRLSRDMPDGMEYIEYENERRPFSGYDYSPRLSQHPQNHHDFHSPINSSTYHHHHHHHHQPHSHQQQKQHQPLPVCVSSSPSHCSEQELVPPSPTLISPPPIYQRAAEPPQDPCSSP